jgi:hypothetical protein
MKTVKFWTRHWQAPDQRLRAMERGLRATLHIVVVGSETDPWDLEVRGGFLGGARIVCAVEEHGAGCQTVRFRVWPKISRSGLAVVAALQGLAYAASLDEAWAAAVPLGLAAIGLGGRMITEAGFATSALLGSIEERRD